MSKPIKRRSLIYGVISMVFMAIIVIDLIAMIIVGNMAPSLEASGAPVTLIQTVMSWVLGVAFGGTCITFFISYLIDNRKS